MRFVGTGLNIGLALDDFEVIMSSEEIKPSQETVSESPPQDRSIILDAKQLFGDQKEICIEHAGERYRLRITRRGRLILCK
jgi:hemin uptake protein HemP